MRRVVVALAAALGPLGCDAPAALPDASPDAPPPSGAFPGCAPGDGNPIPVCPSKHLCWVAPSTLGSGAGVTAIGGGGCDYWLGGDALYRMNGDSITPTGITDHVYDMHVFPSQAWIVTERGTKVFDGTTWRILDGSVSYRVWGAAPDDVWVRRNFDVAHSNGSSLAHVLPLMAPIPSAIWGTSASDVRVIGEDNAILRWDGELWWWERLGEGSRAIDLWGADPDHWFAVASGPRGEAEIWQYDGAAWTRAYSEPGAWLDAIWGSSAHDVWAGGQLGDHVLHFDGVTWSPVELPVARPVYAIHGSGPDDVVFGGAQLVARWDGTRIRMTTTSLVLAPNETEWTGMYGANGSDVWVVADRGTTGHWDGVTWDAGQISSEPILARAISGSSGEDVWVAGARLSTATMHVWHRADAGWSSTDLAVPGVLHAIHAAAPDDAWAVGDGGAIFHYDGKTWSRTPSLTDESLAGVWGNANDAWAVGGFAILHWDGLAWARIAVDSGAPYSSVWMRASDDVYFGGYVGLVHFDGHGFTNMSGPSATITSIGGSASLMWLTDDGAFTFDHGTGGIRIAAPQATWNAAYFPSRTDGWIAGTGGVIMRYRP